MTGQNRFGFADLGVGVGLRGPHIREVLRRLADGHLPIDWFELITDNVLIQQGWLRDVAHRLRAHRPLVLHGLSLGVGGTQRLDFDYIKQIKQLADELQVAWVSDHLCWTSVQTGHGGHAFTYDLLPMPYTDEMLAWTAARIAVVQDVLERPLVLENPSSYLQFHQSTQTEWDFVAALCERADCGLLLDVNNVYVSGRNHDFDPQRWLDAVPWSRVCQVHVAGPTDRGAYLLDTHVGPVPQAVWALHDQVQQRTGGCATLLEWDDEIPSLDGLLQALTPARRARPVVTNPPLPTSVEPVQAWQSPRRPEPTGVPHETLQLYTWFFNAVVDPATAGEPASTWIRTTPGLTGALVAPQARLDVHQAMYQARVDEALTEDFPKLAAALGTQRWRRLCLAYRRAPRPGHWSLDRWGASLPDFVRAEAAALQLPVWTADLALLEWTRCEVWQTPTDAPLDLMALHPGEDLCLRWARTTRLVTVHLQAWRRFTGRPAGRPGRPVQVRVSRTADATLDVEAMGPAEAAWLRTFASGINLQQALTQLQKTNRKLLTRAASWLQAWAQAGVLTRP